MASMEPPLVSGGEPRLCCGRRDGAAVASMEPPLVSGGEAARNRRSRLRARRGCFNGAAARERRRDIAPRTDGEDLGEASMEPPLVSGGEMCPKASVLTDEKA